MSISARLFLILLFLFPVALFAQDQYVIQSKYLDQQDDTIHVYKPASMNVDLVVYMLHGWNGDYRQWSKFKDLQKLADSWNILIVCPDGLKDSWYFDAQLPDDNVYYSQFMMNDLIPLIEKEYNIKEQPRIIYGLSMGGYGAFYLYLKYPQYFQAALSSSGAFDFTNPLMKHYGIDKRLGDFQENPKIWMRMSMLNLLEKKDLNENFIFYLDCGTKDPFYKSNIDVADYLKESKATVFYNEMSGGHNKQFWKNSVILQLFIINAKEH